MFTIARADAWTLVDFCQVSGLGRLSRLRRLSLRDLTGITDTALQSLAPRLRQLEVLVLLGCGRLTDAGISCLVDLRATLKVSGRLLSGDQKDRLAGHIAAGGMPWYMLACVVPDVNSVC